MGGSEYFVLIVEDTPDMASLMQTVLESIGISYYHVDNGPSALEFLSTAVHTPDLLLLDIGLPGMSGWRVLEMIQEKFGAISYPVIVLTAFDDPANRLVGKLQEAVFRYITKPFTASTLANAAREALKMES